MNPRPENKVILVTRKTRLEELITRFNTVEQSRFYVEHLGADFSDYEIEHKNYQAALATVKMQLRNLSLVQVIDRVFLPNFVFGKNDFVVVLGQDGLVANTMKYLNGQPVIAINPDLQRWEGALLPFQVKDLAKIIPDAFKNRRKLKEITMAQITLNTGQKLYGVNDLFIGPKTHTSIRYMIHIGTKEEQHSSSGIIVSTGLGSTGWFKSILTGANGVSTALGKPLDAIKFKDFKWNSNYLFFSVREPWPSKFSQATLIFGTITKNQPMILTSQMPERGVIFSDGIESDFLEFNSGTRATVQIADKKGYLII